MGREEKLLQNFLPRPELTINEPFDVNGPFFLTILALILRKFIDWDQHRIICLQKLLLIAYLRSIPSLADRTKSISLLSTDCRRKGIDRMNDSQSRRRTADWVTRTSVTTNQSPIGENQLGTKRHSTGTKRMENLSS